MGLAQDRFEEIQRQLPQGTNIIPMFLRMTEPDVYGPPIATFNIIYR